MILLVIATVYSSITFYFILWLQIYQYEFVNLGHCVYRYLSLSYFQSYANLTSQFSRYFFACFLGHLQSMFLGVNFQQAKYKIFSSILTIFLNSFLNNRKIFVKWSLCSAVDFIFTTPKSEVLNLPPEKRSEGHDTYRLIRNFVVTYSRKAKSCNRKPLPFKRENITESVILKHLPCRSSIWCDQNGGR